jgi:hypothetical protein
VEGAKAGYGARLMHRYVDHLLRLGTVDPKARLRFLEVQGMLREASAILGPDMLGRIIKSALWPSHIGVNDPHDDSETTSRLSNTRSA